MIIVPLAVLWGGYTLVYYGYCLLKGPGIGMADLGIPGKWTEADTKLRSLGVTDNAKNMDPSKPGNVGGGDFGPAPAVSKA